MFGLDLLREIDLIAGLDVDLLGRIVAAAGAVHHVNAKGRQQVHQRERVLHAPPALHPLDAAEAHAQRTAEHGANGSNGLQQHAAAVFERAAVRVRALVGRGRQERRQKVLTERKGERTIAKGRGCELRVR